MKKNYITLLLLIVVSLAYGQKFTISGFVTDKNTGETLIGANVIDTQNENIGTSTNAYGFYSLTLPEGKHIIAVSYLGYQTDVYEINLTTDTKHNFDMSEGVLMDEVIVTSTKDDARKNVESTQMGSIDIPIEEIKKLPVLFGEVDILKVLQLLPGVLSAGEGTSGFYVRGGGPDQNLLLLDEAVVYNSGHLLGFFSVFNSDAIKKTTLIKGGMPAQYGGRLSSVIDIQMKEGNNQKYAAEGGIGIISSRLTFEGPIVKDKSSFIISGRRTYALDLAQPFLRGGNFEGTNYYFYDLNTKLNYKFSDKDRLYFSAYFGRDVFKFRQPKRDFFFDLPYGNSTATLRWNHVFSDKLFFNASAIYNDYQFSFRGGQDQFIFKLFSGVKDWNAKLDFDYFLNNVHSIKYGLNFTYHTLTPNTAQANNGDVDFNTGFLPKYGQETAIYIQDDIKVSNNFSLNAGLRGVAFSQLGPYTSKVSGEEFGRLEPAITYTGLEPRMSFRYGLSQNTSIKGGVTMANQFLHLVSNSASTLPTDVWVPSTETVRPQRSIQYATGYFQNFQDDKYETSIEVYYKTLKNQIDYADDYVNDITKEVEDAFVYGKGRAYGAEFFLKKAKGKLNGWIGYTLSKTERSFDGIEGGRWYPAVYDRRHDLSIVGNYQLTKKLEIGGAFIFGTGKWYTPTKGFFFTEQTLNLYYGPRNSERLPSYHRMDLSLNYTPNPDSKRKWKGSWNFSVYNVYNRKNPFFINFETNTDFNSGTTSIEGNQITIFPIIPSITYNFKWNQ
ncbi:MAG TPA: TonB-dependent receptor [Saprospiraceae bacterium]|nr:TonB-dependent receptor [Saprospiraceae bacterium]